MSRTRGWWHTIGLAAAGVVLAGSAMLTAGAPAFAAGPAKAGGKAKATVKVGDNYFKPDDITVVAGTKVVWKNEGKILHNVRPVKGSSFGTKSLPKGDRYSYTFKKPGEYAYFCSFHGSPTSGQRGVIVVKAAPTPTAPPTTGATPPTTARSG